VKSENYFEVRADSARFEVPTALKMKICVPWDVVSVGNCSIDESKQR
jgi:hypothetical protein